MPKMQAVMEDENDWLVSYLATTKVGADPKLNSATTKLANVLSASRSTASSSKTSEKQKALATKKASTANRRRSWAAARVTEQSSIAASVSTTAAPVAAAEITETSAAGAAAASSSRTSEPQAQNRGTNSSKAGGGAAANSRKPRPKTALESDWLVKESKVAQRRVSMTGRRQSVDYSDLDAVRERLNNAATLWAVAEPEATSDEESDLSSAYAPSPSGSVQGQGGVDGEGAAGASTQASKRGIISRLLKSNSTSQRAA